MATRRFDVSKESVGAARRFVIGTITDAPSDVRDSVSLMVSELATNALVHAASGFDVTVDRGEHFVVVAVNDRGTGGNPVLQMPESDEPHGRGLQIVDALSDDWGIASTMEEGKTVWFRMSLEPSVADGSDDVVVGADRRATASAESGAGQHLDHSSTLDRPLMQSEASRNSGRRTRTRRSPRRANGSTNRLGTRWR
jgi:anti-sigma regulatory factor (Ser/Thr protein kinase)